MADSRFANLLEPSQPAIGQSNRFAGLLDATESDSYSAWRSGAVDFAEGLLGVGDELDAVARLMAGEAENWASAIEMSREDLARFEEENPLASKALTGAGFVGAFFIPGLGMARVASTGSKAARIAKGAALASAEGSVYGALAGEGEEGRVKGALLGAGLGGALGGGVSAVATKSPAPTIKKFDSKRPGQGSFIGGEEGFANVGRARETGRAGTAADTSLQQRRVRDVQVGAATSEAAPKPSGTAGSIFLSNKAWLEKNVSPRAARLAEDAELMVRHDSRQIDEIFETQFLEAAKAIDSNVFLKEALLRVNPAIKKERRLSWEDVRRVARTPRERLAVDKLKQQTELIRNADFVQTKEADYFPAVSVGKIDSRVANPDLYIDPVKGLKEFAQDVSAARALAYRFGIDPNNIKTTTKKLEKSGGSRLNLVINAIEKEAKRQGASPDVAANLANGLRSQFVAAQKGGNAVGAVVRRTVSAALLGNPLNALLNMSEGMTAPIYQNGVRAWASTLPRAIMSTISQEAGISSKKWLSTRELGLDKDFMGELANVGEKALNDAANTATWTRVPDKAVKGLDWFNAKLYQVSGASRVNRMGQEMLANASIVRGRELAKKGKLDELRGHDGMRGLTESEFYQTVDALKKGDLTNPYLLNFAGASLNKWQPVSASALPKAFHDNPNGRMAYSMLSYMNRQMNNIRTDIGLKLMDAQKLGANTPEGQKALREAMKNSAKYAGLFGVLAGFWDDWRKTLDLSKDEELKDLLTPDGMAAATLNQLSSNISSGLYNMRSEEFGGKPIEPIPAPLTAMGRLASGASKGLLTGDPDEFLRASQTYLPGVSNIDRIVRATTGERLFEKLGAID